MIHPQDCTRFLSEKEIMQDSLSSQKFAADNYNTFAGECVNEALRDTMLNILDDEHIIQSQIFNVMRSNGWYQVENAPQEKITEAKMKFSARP